jgi:hypothetical protein
MVARGEATAKPLVALRPYRFAAAFSSTDADAVFECQHKYFAVPDGASIACSGGMDNRFHRGFNERLIHGNLEL